MLQLPNVDTTSVPDVEKMLNQCYTTPIQPYLNVASTLGKAISKPSTDIEA